MHLTHGRVDLYLYVSNLTAEKSNIENLFSEIYMDIKLKAQQTRRAEKEKVKEVAVRVSQRMHRHR